MLVTTKAILDDANNNDYAVIAVNCINMEMVKACISAAERELSPIIISVSPRQRKIHAKFEAMAPMILSLVNESKIPIALHLDHGEKYEDIFKSLAMGFSSIMFDGSKLSFEENVKMTKYYSSLVHDNCCSIEAELGHVGMAINQEETNIDLYTNVDKAVEFLKETGVDSLAVAIGTAHGEYPKDYVPKLDFNRLKKLKESLKIPLVLHGGSGSGEENIRKAVEGGINKINICTDIFRAGKKAIITKIQTDKEVDFMDLMSYCENSMSEYISHFMKLVGSSNRVPL